MAFSTPAQNPRGSASSTRSTGMAPGYRPTLPRRPDGPGAAAGAARPR